MRLRHGLIVWAILLAVSPAFADEAKDLRGVWTVAAGEFGGRNMSGAEKQLTLIVIHGETFLIKGANLPVVLGTIKVDTSKIPNTFDLTAVFGEGKEQKTTAPGIFELREDALKLCWRMEGQERPAKFESPAREPIVFMTLNKVTVSAPAASPAKKEPAKIEIPKDETPKGAMLRELKLVDNLDADKLAEFFAYSGKKEEEFAHALAKSSVAEARVELAIEARFGKQARAAYVHAIGQMNQQDIISAHYKIDGDLCAVQIDGESDPFNNLIKVDGVWKQNLHGHLEDDSDEEIDDRVTFHQNVAKKVKPFGEKIAGGQLKSLEAIIIEGAKLYNQLEEAHEPPARKEL